MVGFDERPVLDLDRVIVLPSRRTEPAHQLAT
jgi:hypothetical protein